MSSIVTHVSHLKTSSQSKAAIALSLQAPLKRTHGGDRKGEGTDIKRQKAINSG